MRPHHDYTRRAEVYTREQLEALHGSVLDVRAFARRFVLVGIDGLRVAVRDKSGGRAVGTLRYQTRPLYFFDYLPMPGGQPRPHHTRRERP